MKKLLLLIILIPALLSGQELKLYGNIMPAALIIGHANNIEWAFLDTLQLQTDKSGFFVFGFDRNDTGSKLLKVKIKSGPVYLKVLKLPERKYKVDRINRMQKKYVSPPKSVNERISKERKIGRAARAKIGEIDSAFFKAGFTRPVKGGRISSVFGGQRILNGVKKSPHNGLDIALPRGTPVYAMTDGIVRLAADNFYYAGNYILIDHGQGLTSVYLHLSKKNVKEGDFVRKGDKIGEIGTTGRSTGPHLHWGVQWFGKRIDPASLLKLTFNE